MRGLVLLLALALGGCAELHEHALGTRVHVFTIKEKQYVHCSILLDRSRPAMVEDSIKVCRDGVEQSMQVPQPHQ